MIDCIFAALRGLATTALDIPWTSIAQLAPIVTACIALLAVIVAIISIQTQKGVARRRAAIDIFLKTEMDEKLIDAHNNYKNGIAALKQATSMESFEKTDDYRRIRSYLNIHELIAVGVHQSVFDENVCFDYWADELLRAYKESEALINSVCAKSDGLHTYADLRRLYWRWHRRNSSLSRKT